jgi:hypothetical protein
VSDNELDPHAVLGVGANASAAEIRRRYRILIQIYHPDRYQSSSREVQDEANKLMKQINTAYATLNSMREREARAREARARQAREREAREAREREARAREAREREAREAREARERAARERDGPEQNEESTGGSRWSELPIHPILIVFPSGGEGYTMRAYVDSDGVDEAIFLQRDDGLLVFRSASAMRRYVLNNSRHVLTEVSGWDGVRSTIEEQGLEPDPDDCYYLDLVLRCFQFPPSVWLPEAFISCRDLALELAYAFDLPDVHKLLQTGSDVDHFDDILRDTQQGKASLTRRLRRSLLDRDAVEDGWTRIINRIERIVCWRG